MPSKELINISRTLVRELALPGNKGTDLKALINEAFNEVSEQTINELSLLEQTIKNFTGSPQLLPAQVTAPSRPKGSKRFKNREQSIHEKEIRELLSDPKMVMDLAKKVGYGTVPSTNAVTPNNMFKTTGLVNQVWKKQVGCGLNSVVVRGSLAGTLGRTLRTMEKEGKAKRVGTSRATKWFLLRSEVMA